MFEQHHPRSYLSIRAVSAAAADAEAVPSTSSAAQSNGSIDVLGSQLHEEEDEEKLPESFQEFDLDDRVTVSSLVLVEKA